MKPIVMKSFADQICYPLSNGPNFHKNQRAPCRCSSSITVLDSFSLNECETVSSIHTCSLPPTRIHSFSLKENTLRMKNKRFSDVSVRLLRSFLQDLSGKVTTKTVFHFGVTAPLIKQIQIQTTMWLLSCRIAHAKSGRWPIGSQSGDETCVLRNTEIDVRSYRF